jgi:hypothetical protein
LQDLFGRELASRYDRASDEVEERGQVLLDGFDQRARPVETTQIERSILELILEA